MTTARKPAKPPSANATPTGSSKPTKGKGTAPEHKAERTRAWPRRLATMLMLPMGAAGVFHLALGLGLVQPPPSMPVDKVFALWNPVFSSVFPSWKELLLFIGASKVLGVIAIAGYLGGFLDTLANLGFVVLCAFATFTHIDVMRDSPGGPIFMLLVSLNRLFLPKYASKNNLHGALKVGFNVFGCNVLLLSILIGTLFSGHLAKTGIFAYFDSYEGERGTFFKGMFPAMHQGTPWGFTHAEIPPLGGKVVLVTGANTGLGYWTARYPVSFRARVFWTVLRSSDFSIRRPKATYTNTQPSR
jgi:hypothetical protein